MQYRHRRIPPSRRSPPPSPPPVPMVARGNGRLYSTRCRRKYRTFSPCRTSYGMEYRVYVASRQRTNGTATEIYYEGKYANTRSAVAVVVMGHCRVASHRYAFAAYRVTGEIARRTNRLSPRRNTSEQCPYTSLARVTNVSITVMLIRTSLSLPSLTHSVSSNARMVNGSRHLNPLLPVGHQPRHATFVEN